jgi:hypothetical protein
MTATPIIETRAASMMDHTITTLIFQVQIEVRVWIIFRHQICFGIFHVHYKLSFADAKTCSPSFSWFHFLWMDSSKSRGGLQVEEVYYQHVTLSLYAFNAQLKHGYLLWAATNISKKKDNVHIKNELSCTLDADALKRTLECTINFDIVFFFFPN